MVLNKCADFCPPDLSMNLLYRSFKVHCCKLIYYLFHSICLNDWKLAKGEGNENQDRRISSPTTEKRCVVSVLVSENLPQTVPRIYLLLNYEVYREAGDLRYSMEMKRHVIQA